jgi:hypothetical protein
MAGKDPETETGSGLAPDQVRHRKEAVLAFLGELFPMPELYETSDRFTIPEVMKSGSEKLRERKMKITLELTEREAKAFETIMTAERKIRGALAEAAGEINEE